VEEGVGAMGSGASEETEGDEYQREFAREAMAAEKGRWAEHRTLSKDHGASYRGLRSAADEKLVLGLDSCEIMMTWPNIMQELEL
jgi:hypothetical protein